MKHFVSIIMPAFNAESRIEKTIHSLEGQSYKEFEIVIIDDGSKDNTALICDSLSKQYSNISVLHEENAGPGKAREKGVRIAKGDIIAFVDSDDYLSDDALDVLVSKMDSTGADILQFGYKMIDDNGNILSEHPLQECNFESGKEAFGYFIAQKNCTNFLWNKVYKHTLFHSIEWPGIFYSEDYVVLAQLYGKATRALTIENPLYYYVQHNESAVNKPFTVRKLDQITAGEYVVGYTRKNYAEYLPEALFYLATRSARLAEMAKKSSLENKRDIYHEVLAAFKASYSEMRQVLKQQNRTLELDKMTRIFGLSPNLAFLLKYLYKGFSI